MNNIPYCIEIATYNECAVNIEMKVIFRIIVVIKKRLQPFDVRELRKLSKRTINIKALQLLDSQVELTAPTMRVQHAAKRSDSICLFGLSASCRLRRS